MPDEPVRMVHASGECEIDLARRELRVLGAPVPVGGRAFEVIEVLARSAGEIVTKNQLMDRIWPGAAVTENTLHVHAMAVRKALGPYRTLLKTESRRGYRLLGDWSVRPHDASRPPAGMQRTRVDGDTPATNFPSPVTHLIGRSAALTQLRDLMSAYRLVTLTGPGGIGKTSLALQAARDTMSEFANGGWLVELASLSDPALVPTTVAGALRLPAGPANATAETVARAVGDQRLLLVLDNCEHLIEAAAILAETFLARCPRTTIIATSRETLSIQGESVFRVPPLEVPAAGRDEADHILNTSAVELFINRTKALDTSFLPRAGELRTIAAICRHLDGIPLAIEFASARAAVLGIEQVVGGLDDRFASLTRGRRNAVPRHRTLRAALDWSYELLSGEEQRLLRHLAVFPASFELEAAAAVAPDDAPAALATIDGIASLVSKSLVTLDRPDSSGRWRLLETVRIYALRKLAEHGETRSAQRRHARYFRDYFTRPVPSNPHAPQLENLAPHIQHIDDVRAALDWSFGPSGDVAVGVELTAAFAQAWIHMSLGAECRDRCDIALLHCASDETSDPVQRMRLLTGLGTTLLLTMGPGEKAVAALTHALELAERLQDLDAEARILWALYTALNRRGDRTGPRRVAERLATTGERLGDHAIIAVACRLLSLMLLRADGRPREAQKMLERALIHIDQAPDQPHTVWSRSENRAGIRSLLALALCVQGQVEAAQIEASASLAELDINVHQLSYCRSLVQSVCQVALLTGDLATADWAIGRLQEVAAHGNVKIWAVHGKLLEAGLMIARGEFADGVRLFNDTHEYCRQVGWQSPRAEFDCYLATALVELGQSGAALDVIEAASASASGGDDAQMLYVPELLRIKGEALLRLAKDQSAEPAEACFRQAIDVARQQGALLWELRTALSLARLRVAQARRDEARDILLPVYQQFTEGLATADLRAARTMLDALTDRAR